MRLTSRPRRRFSPQTVCKSAAAVFIEVLCFLSAYSSAMSAVLVPSSQILLLFVLLTIPSAQTEEDPAARFFRDCPVSYCRHHDRPEIRFPFRLKELHTQSCGLAGFELTCKDDKTVLQLPSGEETVTRINYLDKIIAIKVSDAQCPIQSIRHLNLSDSPFNFFFSDEDKFLLVNCSSKNATMLENKDDGIFGPITCLSDQYSSVFIVDGEESIEHVTCEVIEYVPISPVPEYDGLPSVNDFMRMLTKRQEIVLKWHAKQIGEGCTSCEQNRSHCGFNSTTNRILCYHPPSHRHGYLLRDIIIVASIVSGLIISVILILVYLNKNSNKENQNRLKVETFLANYKSLNPTRYSYAHIRKMTNKFKHRLGKGAYGSVYKGKLPNGVPVAIKMLVQSTGDGQEFINEVATLGQVHHINVVRLLGFCSDGYKRALIYEFLPNESLEKFIFSREAKTRQSLGWEKLYEIAMGVARGIEYLHQGCDQRILHFDIKPHNILLDHNFHPKISDFGLAKLCSKEQSIITMTAARGTMGYIAPELFSRNFGTVSYKSDVYSFGMLVLEMVGGRKNIDVTVENTSQVYFPEWIYSRLDQGGELGIEVATVGEEETARKLTIIALWCIQWNPIDRPSMKKVVQMLEADLQSLQIPPKPFISSTDTRNDTTSPDEVALQAP